MEIKPYCEMCKCNWLGGYFGQPLCNQCRYQELGAFEPIGGEDDVEGVGDEKEKLPPPEDDEMDAMYDSMVGSGSKEYRTAHE